VPILFHLLVADQLYLGETPFHLRVAVYLFQWFLVAVAIPSHLPVVDQLYPAGTPFRLRVAAYQHLWFLVAAEASSRRVGQFQYPPQHQPPYRRLNYRSC